MGAIGFDADPFCTCVGLAGIGTRAWCPLSMRGATAWPPFQIGAREVGKLTVGPEVWSPTPFPANPSCCCAAGETFSFLGFPSILDCVGKDRVEPCNGYLIEPFETVVRSPESVA